MILFFRSIQNLITLRARKEGTLSVHQRQSSRDNTPRQDLLLGETVTRDLLTKNKNDQRN